jgi:hypothetical protein
MPGVEIQADGSRVGKISMEIQNVIGEGGPDYPRLRVPVEISLSPLQRAMAPQVKWFPLTLLQLAGELNVAHVRIGQFQETLALYSNNPTYPNTTTTGIHVPLDPFRVGRIEGRRRGELTLSFWFSPLLAIHTESGQVERFAYISCELSIPMPQSHWIDKVLPGLGYGKIELVEISIPETALPEIFSKAVEELNHAKRFLNEGSNGDCVARCRNIIQLIVDSKKVKMPEGETLTFPKRVDAFVEQHLGQLLAESKREAFASLLKTLWSFTSIPHHPAPPEYFNRGDAELCLRSAAALLAYGGRLLK